MALIKLNPAIPTFARFIDQLYMRWQDEREYEDWEEYIKAMKRCLPEGAAFVSAKRRPFGCRFTHDGETYEVRVRARGVSIFHIPKK